MSTLFRSDGSHDWHSESYVAEWIDQDATRDEERRPLLRRVAGLLPGPPDEPIRVLDVGGGYGPLSAEVLALRPRAEVTLHDYSEAMIAAAEERLSDAGPRVRYQLSDMSEPGWGGGLGGPFDAVVSSLAVHNLDEPERVLRAYREMLDLLRPGGVLVNADLALPGSPELAELYRRDPTRNLNWDPRVSPIDLRCHLDGLRDTGFVDVDCVWKDLELCVLWARRPD